MYEYDSYVLARLESLERKIEQLIMKLAQIEEEIKTTSSQLASASKS